MFSRTIASVVCVGKEDPASGVEAGLAQSVVVRDGCHGSVSGRAAAWTATIGRRSVWRGIKRIVAGKERDSCLSAVCVTLVDEGDEVDAQDATYEPRA